MAYTTTMQMTETNLRFRLESGIIQTDTTISGRWYDIITNEIRVPDSTTKLIVLDKGDTSIPNQQYEIVLLGTVSVDDGLYVYTNCTRGLAFNGFELTGDTNRAKRHNAGAIGGTVDVHFLYNTIIATLRGEGEAWSVYRVATLADRDADITSPENGMLCYVEEYEILYFYINDRWTASPIGVFANTTERDAAIPSPSDGDSAYVIDDGVFYDYQGGAWITRGTSTTPNATESSSGKTQLANLVAQRTKATVGVGPYVLQPQYATDTPFIYTPSYLTGGNAAQNDFDIWNNITNGSFRIPLDGTTYNVDGINFTSALSMADVASIIQTALRTASGTLVTVVWSTNHFVITSANTTSASIVGTTTTSTGTVGTDISGAGASNWMDCDVGGTTITQINFAAHYGYNLLLDSTGKVNQYFLPNSGFVAQCGEPISAGKWIRLGSDGKVYLASNNTISNAAVIGFATNTTTLIDQLTFYQSDGIYTTTGLSAGQTYYLGINGDVTATVARTLGTVVPVMLGRALSTTALAVSIQRLPRTKEAYQQLVTASGPYTITVGFPIEYITANTPGYFFSAGDVVSAPSVGYFDVPNNVQKAIYPNGALGGTSALVVADIASSSAQTIWTASINGSNNLVLTESGSGAATMDAIFIIHELI